MAERFLSSLQASQLLGVNRDTMRRYLREGKVRALRLGKDWKIPESSLSDLARGGRIAKGGKPIAPASREYSNGSATTARHEAHEPTAQAAAILSGLDSDNPHARNAAIMALSQADAQTGALVEAQVARSMAEYSGPEDDWSDWRALDGEPFHFPEEAAL